MNIEERNKLVEENIKLVHYVVGKYFNKYGDTEEFISEGYIGLIKAANAYNKNSQYSFSTLAHKCIYNEISRYLIIQNYNCRKANLNTVSIYNKVFKEDDDLTYVDLFKNDEDYSVANVSCLLDLIDTFNIKDARFMIIKRAEGYLWKEIGNMLGISGELARCRVSKIKNRLIRLGVIA